MGVESQLYLVYDLLNLLIRFCSFHFYLTVYVCLHVSMYYYM